MKRFLLLFLIIGFPIYMFSQTISVSSFKLLDTDLTANTAGTTEKDQNGETAALIKVVTTQTGFSFDGGSMGIVKTKQTPGEVWVYVPRGSKKITIKHPQLGVLRDYYYPTSIEAARTYEMVLTTGVIQTIVRQASNSQYLVLKVTPPDAVVELDNELLPIENGTAQKFVKLGTYEYRVQAANYHTSAGKVVVDDPNNKKVLEINLLPAYGWIELLENDDNKGAQVFIDNTLVGTIPMKSQNLPSGEHHLRIVKSLYNPYSQSVVVNDNQTTQITPLLSGDFSVVTIKVENDADIYINEEKKGTGSWTGKLAKGTYLLEAKKNGYRSTLMNAEISADQKDRTIQLAAPTPIYGNLNITSSPSESDVLIDGKKVGQTPIFLPDVLAGSRQVEIVRSGYNDYKSTIEIPENESASVNAVLTQKRVANTNTTSKNSSTLRDIAIKGHQYMLAGNEKAAYEEYKKVPITQFAQLGIGYLNEFARASYFQGHFEDALAASQEGLQKEPRNPTFTRLAMFSSYELKQYNTAKNYIYKYFHETDNAKVSEYDHFYAALIYDALGEKNNAYNEYNKTLSIITDESMIKRWAILKILSDSYLKDKDFEKAIKYYQEFLGCKPDLKFDDEEGLANIYSKYADAVEGAQKAELINKAADVYASAAEKFPIQNAYAAYMSAGLRNKLDNNMEKSLAKPDYQKVIELLASKGDRTKGEDTMLKTSYHYMMFNSYLNKDVPTAKSYAEKILAIDPAYDAAIQIQNLK